MLMEGNEETFCVLLNDRKLTSIGKSVLDKSYWAAQPTLLFQWAQNFVFNSSASLSTLSMQ